MIDLKMSNKGKYRQVLKFIFSFLILAFLTSCQREGLGGNNTIVVSPVYKTRPIKGATVYVRYGATDFPGSAPTDYDTNAHADSSSSTVKITGLRKGDYFIFVSAYDSVNASVVQGGAHVHLASKSGETPVEVQVSQ